MNMKREIELCDDAPFYILAGCGRLRPATTHHLCHRATMGAFHGASMLCYVTHKEHLGLPNAEDVRNGVIAYKIAAHAADVALGRPHARDRDDAISRARADFDWERQFELALDPERARSLRAEALAESGKAADHDERAQYCTMCGPDFCSMRISKEL